MSVHRWWAALVWLAVVSVPTLAADAKEDKGDAAAKEAAAAFFKALQSKKVDAIMETVDVPFLIDSKGSFFSKEATKDRDSVKEFFEYAVKSTDFREARLKIDFVGTLAQAEEKFGKYPDDRRERIERVGGKDFRILLMRFEKEDSADKCGIILRPAGDKWKIVALVEPAGEAKEDKGDAAAKEAAEAFFKALQSKKVDAIMKTVDVPFLDGNDSFKERDQLQKFFEEIVKDKENFANAKFKIVLTGTIAQAEEKVGKEMRDELRKQIEEVGGKHYRIVLLEFEKDGKKDNGGIVVKLADGKGKVVGIIE